MLKGDKAAHIKALTALCTQQPGVLTLAFDAPEIHVAAPPAAVPAPPAPPRPPSVDGAGSEEESDDVVGVDEVMPAAKVGVDKVTLCDWACDEPER